MQRRTILLASVLALLGARGTALADNAGGHGAAAAKPAPPGPRTISFSGKTWLVKSSTGKVGPGPNYFSDSTDNVWVDAGGRLHLKITKAKGKWSSAEIVSADSFGYGTYRFY